VGRDNRLLLVLLLYLAQGFELVLLVTLDHQLLEDEEVIDDEKLFKVLSMLLILQSFFKHCT
jgi:hypothetical protein